MEKIIDFPLNGDYCKKCIYYNKAFDCCENEKYKQNSYKVVCVWGYCPYRKLNKEYK